jgi:hypothetical protein
VPTVGDGGQVPLRVTASCRRTRTTAHTRAHKRTHARTHAHAAVHDRYQYHRAEVVLAGGRNSATQLAHYYYLRCAELGQPYGYLGLAHLVRACVRACVRAVRVCAPRPQARGEPLGVYTHAPTSTARGELSPGADVGG